MPAASTRKVSRARLWFGLLGGAIVWTIHFLSAYVVAEFGCVSQLGERSFGNISLVAWLELALTVVAVLVAATATAVAHRSQRWLQANTVAADSSGEAERYTARAGLFTSGIFTFVILFESIPIFFYLRSC